MKLTLFGHSYILIETKGKRILVDPGKLLFDESLIKNDWANIDILLVTHKHGDHCFTDAIKQITDNQNTH